MQMIQITSFVAILLMYSSAAWSASGITYHGRIVKPDNQPLESATTRFRIQIKAPDAGNCVLWEEEQTRNMLGSNGVFSITIGDSTDTTISYTRVDTYGWSMERVFSNRSQFTTLYGCALGTDYTPNPADGRILEVSFKEAPADPTWEAFPATKINLIPMSLNTLQLEGYRATEFLKIDPYVNQTPISNAGVNTLLSLIAGTSNLYVKPADPLGGDLSGTIGAGTVVGLRGRALGAAVPAVGQVLKFDGTSWVPSADDTGGAPADASYAAKGVVQFDTSAAVSGVTVTAGVARLADTITAAGPIGAASTIPVITYDAKGRLTTVTTAAVDDVNKLPLAGGTMTGPINMGLQNITNATSIAATNFSGRNLLLNDNDTNVATLRAPVNLVADYALTLPTAAPTNGYVLSTDGTGQLSWIAAATGAVVSVDATLPVLSSGGTTPVISLDTGLGINKVPQVGGTALGANGVVVANGTATALTSLNCAVNQVIKFDASGFAVCGADDAGAANAFVQNGNAFGAAAVLGTNDTQSLTLETDNTPRVVITSAGLTGFSSANQAINSGSSNVAIFSSDTQAANVGGSLGFAGQDGTVSDRTFARISGRKVNGTSGNYDGYLSFETRANGSLPQERMRINEAGNVGIGTTSPSARLDVAGNLNVSSGSTYNINGEPVLQLFNGPAFGVSNFFAGVRTGPSSLNTSNAAANTAVGVSSGDAITDGSHNTLLGMTAGSSLTTGGDNTMVGSYAGWQSNGFDNTLIGRYANSELTTGGSNTSLGERAMFVNTTGDNNVAVGNDAMGTEGGTAGDMDNNVVVGSQAGIGFTGGAAGLGPNNNILVGYRAGDNITTGDSNLLVGYDIETPTPTTSNFMSLGNLIFSTGVNGSGTTISTGNVGIGTNTPATKLDVSGAVRIGNDAAACAAGLAGSLRYNGGAVQFCNGSTWQSFGVSGAGLTSLNGQTGNTQTFSFSAVGSTAPSITSSSDVHTLNIPMASDSGVTAGTISKTDYDNFSGKLTSPLTTKGDILVQNATVPARLPVGTNGQILSANSATATGLEWVAAPTGDITSVIAGAGLVDGGTTGDVTLSVNPGSGITLVGGAVGVDVGLGANKIPQVGGTALGANGVVVANGTGTALTSLNCAVGQVIKFDASGFATCAADDTGVANAFVQNGNSFGAAAVIGTNDNNSLNFETNSTTKMTILANGNVGIGTTTPSSPLTVQAGSDGQTVLSIKSPSGVANLEFISNATAGIPGMLRMSDTGGTLRASMNADLNGGTALKANAQGYSAADGMAQAYGSALNLVSSYTLGAENGITFSNSPLSSSPPGAAITFYTSSTGDFGRGGLRFKTTDSGSVTTRMAIDPTGNVGIGVTSPTQQLQVSKNILLPAGVSNTNGNLFFAGDTSGGNDGMRMFSNAGDGFIDVKGTTSANGLVFRTDAVNGSSERMRIAASGNVGIGTQNPGALLEIGNAGTSLGTLRLAGNTSGYVQIQPAAAAGSWNMTLPANAGTNGQVLSTNGSGVTSWTSVAANGGTFLAAAGTAAAPSFSFSGDTNTGLFNSYPDAIGFSVGGTERFTLDGTGFYSGSTLLSPYAGTSLNPSYAFGADSNTGMYSPSEDTIRFTTNSNDRMTILQSGNVGVGTTAPTAKLHIQSGAAGEGVRLRSGNAAQSASYGVGRTSTELELGVAGASNDFFATTAAGDAALKSAIGKLHLGVGGGAPVISLEPTLMGINTIYPQTNLDLQGSMQFRGVSSEVIAPTADHGRIYYDLEDKKFKVSENSGAFVDLVSAGNSSNGTAGHLQFSNGAGGFSSDSNQLFWDATNNRLGIGTNTPAHALDISASSAQVTSASASSTALYLTNTSAGGQAWEIQSTGAVSGFGAGHLNFYGNGTGSLMTLSGAGRVGISNTTPGALLDIGTAGTSLGTLRLAGSTSGYVQLQPAAAAGSWNMTLPATAGTNGQVLTTNGSGVTSWTTAGNGDIRNGGNTTGAAITIGTNDNFGLNLETGGFPRVEIQSTGETIFNNTVVFNNGNLNKVGYVNVDQSTSTLTLEQFNNGTTTNLNLVAGDFASFEFDGTERFRIEDNGNVGILTNAPSTALDLNGALTQRGLATAPALSPADQGRIYFDSTLDRFRVSQNGGGYTDILTSMSGFNANQAIVASGTGVATSFTCPVGQVLGFDASGFAACTVVPSNGSTFLAADGTAAAPSFSFNSVGNSDNGMFLPAANSLGFSTAGVARMTVDATGNVGVGTTSPGMRLDVRGSTSADGLLRIQNGAADGYSSIGIFSSGGTEIAGFGYGNPSVGFAHLRNKAFAYLEGSADFVVANGLTSFMTVRTTGNVGIGTTTPGSLLQVGNEGTQLGTLRLAGNTSGYVQLQSAAAAGSWNMTLPANAGTNGQALTTNGSGVTSWTTIPSNGGTFSAGDGSAANPSITFSNDPNTGLYSEAGDTIGFSTNGAKRLTMNASVMKYIGTGFINNYPSSYTDIGLFFGHSTVNSQIAVPSTPLQSSSLRFFTATANNATQENMTIMGNGSVGIRNSNPLALLHVGTSGTSLGTVRLSGNTSGYVQIQPAAAAGSWNMTLPADAGTNGQALVTNGSGVTSWATVPTSGGTFIAGAGSGGAPSISFTGDPDTGFFQSGPETIGITVSGINTADIGNNEWSIYRKIRTANCAVSLPCYSFVSDPNSGMYPISDDIVGFSTNGVERMRLSAGGELSIGNTSTAHALNVTGSAGLSTGTAWTNTSDARLKDIHGDYEYGLNEILKLNTVRFNYKKNNALDLNSDVAMTGFVAQEVQKVIPDAVTTRADGYLELNVDPIHWATVNAVQDLHGMCKATDQQTKANTEDISSIKRELASLKDENQNLKSENEKMKKDLEMIKKKLGL